MATKLLICDDSNMARKQVARSLPDDWDVDISFAKNGVEGIEAIKEGKGDVLLLDLNMPVMDGYQVLEEIIKAQPTDGLWEDGRTDEKQLGLTYKEVEEAMSNTNSKKRLKYEEIRKLNLHKMESIPVCKIPK